MRIKNLLSLLLALPLFFVACEPDKPVDPTPDKEYAAELTLTSDAEMNFGAEGGEGVITYTAKMVEVTREAPEAQVEATCEADWVTDLTVAEEITFTVAANEAEARETKITVTYSDKSFEVAVKQAAQGEEPEPEYALDVELAAAMRIPSAELELADNYFALAFVDDAENTELGIVLKGAEDETILKAGDYTSEAETLLVDACELYVYKKGKPMSKRSNRIDWPQRELWTVRSQQEAARRMALRGRSEQGEDPSVAADGDRTRYQGGAYGCMRREWAQCANLGGTAGVKSCPNRDKAFFVYRKGDLL